MRYEYIGGSSRKFWDVVMDEQGKYWVVRVQFGRIGTAGQTHTKVFSYKSGAQRYYDTKVAEKTAKGYTLKSAPKPIFLGVAVAAPKPAPPKPVCTHSSLVRKNGVYECVICKSKVEFNEPQANTNTPEFETTVRRFFDLRARA